MIANSAKATPKKIGKTSDGAKKNVAIAKIIGIAAITYPGIRTIMYVVILEYMLPTANPSFQNFLKRIESSSITAAATEKL